jgi:hypothetical protein
LKTENTLEDYINKEFGPRGISKAAKAWGIPRQSLQYYIDGSRYPRAARLVLLQTLTSGHVDWVKQAAFHLNVKNKTKAKGGRA